MKRTQLTLRSATSHRQLPHWTVAGPKQVIEEDDTGAQEGTRRRLASSEVTLLAALPGLDEASAQQLWDKYGSLSAIKNVDPVDLAADLVTFLGIAPDQVSTPRWSAKRARRRGE